MPTRYVSILDQLESEAFRSGQQAGTKKAMEWFRKRISQLGQFKDDDRHDILKDKTRQTSVILPGRMYLYKYDPKHKATLPYYDLYPLIFPIEFYDNGHLGINFHYLPPKLRASLFDAMLRLTSNKNFDESTKMKMNYEILRRSTKYNAVIPCIKRYLRNHVRSKLLQIESYDWAAAIFLPMAKFQKAPITKVWQDSRVTIRNEMYNPKKSKKKKK